MYNRYPHDNYYGYNRYYVSPSKQAENWANAQPIDDLLYKQRNGGVLNRFEKERLNKEAEKNRKANLCKN